MTHPITTPVGHADTDEAIVRQALCIPEHFDPKQYLECRDAIKYVCGIQAMSDRRIAVASSREHNPIDALPYTNLRDALLFVRHNLANDLPDILGRDDLLWETVRKRHAEGTLPRLFRDETTQKLHEPHKPYDYQRYSAERLRSTTEHSLLVLETAAGKTLIAAMVMEMDPAVISGDRLVLLSAPANDLVDQHTETFLSGKCGRFVIDLMKTGRLLISTPQKLQGQLDTLCATWKSLLIFLDEGDIGMREQTGLHAHFQIAEKLGIAPYAGPHRLIAMSATTSTKDVGDYEKTLGITNVIDRTTDPELDRMCKVFDRERERQIRYCSPRWQHTQVVEHFRKKLLETIKPLVTAHVHKDAEHVGFPRFPAPKPGEEPRIPTVPRQDTDSLLVRLHAIVEGTFRDNDVVHPNAQRGLLGLWNRWDDARQSGDPDLMKEVRQDIREYESAIRQYQALIDMHNTVECSSYAPFLEKMADIADRILCMNARKLVEKPDVTQEELEKSVFPHAKLLTPLRPAVTELKQSVLRLAYARYRGNQEALAREWAEVHDQLRSLAAKAPKAPPEFWEYPIFNDWHLRTAMEAIRDVGLHPKEDLFLRVLREALQEKTSDDSGKEPRVLVSVTQISTLTRLHRLALDHWYKADFIVGGGDAATKLHNKIVRKIQELGIINVILGTKVTDRGMDLPGINRVIVYDPHINDTQRVQREGRSGRDGGGARVYALLYRGAGSQDDILRQVFEQKPVTAGGRRQQSAMSAAIPASAGTPQKQRQLTLFQ